MFGQSQNYQYEICDWYHRVIGRINKEVYSNLVSEDFMGHVEFRNPEYVFVVGRSGWIKNDSFSLKVERGFYIRGTNGSL